MGVVILGDLFQFPEGGAATNRVFTYAKGLKECTVKVDVVCFGNDYVKETSGIAEGIPYNYPFGQQERNPSFFVRRWLTLKKYWNTYTLLKKISKTQPIDSIIAYSNLSLTHVYAWILSRLFGAVLLNECNEHPLRYYQDGFWKRKQGLFKCYLEAHLADGIICISQYLVQFFRQKGVSEKRLLLLPSTVDNTRFQLFGTNPMKEPYIGYFGSLTFDRDNVDLLIRAFARMSAQQPGVRLVLGGLASQAEKEKIRRLVSELGIDEKVQVLGFLPREEITRYITHAGALVMVRGKDLQSEASYPSKLSEFLATSKPVVAVKVGDVPVYLNDGVHAYLVEPGDTDGLAQKLAFIFNNYQQAVSVGQKGYELTTTTFHYRVQVERLLSFIQSLKIKKR